MPTSSTARFAVAAFIFAGLIARYSPMTSAGGKERLFRPAALCENDEDLSGELDVDLDLLLSNDTDSFSAANGRFFEALRSLAVAEKGRPFQFAPRGPPTEMLRR